MTDRTLPSQSTAPEPFEGTGWNPSRMPGSIYVGNLPGRKQVCLYTEERGVIRTLAFFKTEEKARMALRYFNALMDWR